MVRLHVAHFDSIHFAALSFEVNCSNSDSTSRATKGGHSAVITLETNQVLERPTVINERLTRNTWCVEKAALGDIQEIGFWFATEKKEQSGSLLSADDEAEVHGSSSE
ncbi:hypothetical protein DBV15_05671 [Temnothorax longispinosus]|uniref:Uncharacterized protein n=1 Tax=Temnothorax longispinosus TaxID=300112 RepID=A0A4S2JME7_9HYME|nr:hypothetical protein DBV15_05671 [Temnothorax longispinosus]